MGLDQRDKIDFLSIEKDGEAIVLTLVAYPLVGEELGHLHMLEVKIKRYLDFVGSGEAYEVARRLSPKLASAAKVRIDIVSPDGLSTEHGAAFLRHWKGIAGEEGVELSARAVRTQGFPAD